MRDSVTEHIDYLAAYTHGYSDATEGRPADARSRMKEAVVKSATTKVITNVSSQPSPQAMADRANAYQAEQAKLGRTITNTDAVKHVYFEAGVPLE
jgi:hypothetical protein